MSKSHEYADEFERANNDAIAFAQSCSSEAWNTVVPGEGWPVCVLVHHVAVGHDLVSGWIDCALEGRSIDVTADEIDAANKQHAEEFASVSPAETVELLRANGGSFADKMRSLDESALQRTAPFAPAGGQLFSVEQFCNTAAAHVRSHLGHAREATSA